MSTVVKVTMLSKRISRFLLFILLLNVGSSLADNDVNDFDVVANNLFWTNLYKFGGWTLHCGYRFEEDQKTTNGRPVRIEHIYSTSWMM